MMRPFAPLALLALVTTAVAADVCLQEVQFSGDVRDGRRLFVEQGCVRCHAVLGSGGKVGPDLVEVGKGKSFFDTLGRLWSHSPEMVKATEEEGASWPEFSPKEMDDLLSYLYYLNYFDKPGDFNRGEKVFSGKGCIGCHSVGHKGGAVGPALDPLGNQASPLPLVAAMWNHGPNMALKMKELSIPKPEFQGSDVADLLAYIRGITVTSAVRREYVAPGDPGKGRGLFSEVGCNRCHSVRGEGGGEGLGGDLAEADLQRSVSELAGIMWNHGPIMWKQMRELELEVITFKPEDMAHIIAYLYFINYYGETGDPSPGEKVFAEKGCAVCHPVGGSTEGVGPDLLKTRVLERPASFAAALWNHAPAMMRTAEEKIVAWPEFRGSEMVDLHAYLSSLQTEEEEEEEEND